MKMPRFSDKGATFGDGLKGLKGLGEMELEIAMAR